MPKNKIVPPNVQAGIETADPTTVLIHAADSQMSGTELRSALVETLYSMAAKAEADAEEVGKSIGRTERHMGCSNSHELKRAENLRRLADELSKKV